MPSRFAIDPRIAAHGGVHTVEHVLPFVPVLIGEDGVGEGLAVAGGAAIVDHQGGPAVRCVNLILEIERRSLLAVRAAVNIDNQRIFSVGAKIRGKVRNASTVHLLSLLMKVKGSTGSTVFPLSTS